MRNTLELTTPRLILVGADETLLRAEIESRESLAVAIGSMVPAEWPPEHHDRNTIDWALHSLELLRPNEPWRMFYIVVDTSRTLIGTCGFGTAPDTNGCVEVGYTVLEEFRCRGFACEAVMELMNAALAAGASEVAAETYPSLVPSLRVMEKCGMIKIGGGGDPNTVRYSKQL